MVYLIVDCDVIQCGGQQFVNIKHVHIDVENIGHYSLTITSWKSAGYSNRYPQTVNRVMNANWRFFLVETKPQLETVVGETIESLIMITPMFDNNPMQDFFESNLLNKWI